ncbi:MAG: putative O-glycosylation ligase, exosortase A system-associated [Methylovulum sp.]|nr:putative O-glycosylation ligase, exosortase A system-associated [Methylovulum sp.]
MRDILVTFLFIVGVGYTIKQPYMGVLVWSWLGYMNPHRLCFGFAYSLPLSYIIALLTTVVYAFSGERKSLPKDKLVVLLILFIFWMGITTLFAFHPDIANEDYIKILKIQFPIILTLAMFNDKQRLHQLLWIIVFSLGYFGVKGGIFTALTGGSFRVYGPPGSYIEENNTLAVACLMVIPLMIYLRTHLTRYWQRQLMLFCIFSISFSVLGSQSRGAFIAIATVGFYFWLQSKNKIGSAILLAIFVAILALILPESWYERMDTIDNYQEDESSMGRINAWTMAYNVANDNILGGGLGLWSPQAYFAYLPEFKPGMAAFVAHSIYFSVLGEHGWIGLMLYLTIFYLAWRYCSQLVRDCDNNGQTQWIADLARMIKLSLLAYLSGGAFLSLSYFDLPWHLVAIVILLKEISKQSITVDEKRPRQQAQAIGANVQYIYREDRK